MVHKEEPIEEIDAYGKAPMEDLTVNDALIAVAVCAAKESGGFDGSHRGDESRIAAMAQKQPLFSGLDDSIDPSISLFMNMIGTSTDLVEPIAIAATVLNPAQKEIAFTWAAEMILPDGLLTEKRQRILKKYASLLKIDRTVAQQILADMIGQP
jgi:hypothetical protein